MILDSISACTPVVRPDRLSDPSGFELTNPAHSMPPVREFLEPFVIRNVIQMFVSTQDQRVIPALLVLLDYPDLHVRVKTIQALENFLVVKALPQLQVLLKKDQSVEVREAAKKAITALTDSHHPPSSVDAPS